MANVYTKEHNAQMRIKDSPYAGAARVLGYDDKQRGWIDDIRDARKAEEKQQKRKDILGFLLMCLGYLGVFLLIAGLFAGGFHVLSQAHNGGATTKPAVTSSVTDSPTPTPSSTPTATSKCTTVIGSYSVTTGICKEDTSGIKINLKSVVTALIVIFFMLTLITLPMRL
ncbi:hypothetical protein MBO12_01460 [Candidatus Saccharibacteria bacterium]|nr:hypothetical protein [Candidatus Saccharibacteria bacterium]